MRFTNTFLLVALLTFSYTNSFEFASLSEINEIKSTPYGKSLVETISLALEQKGNVDEVQKLLNDLLFKLNKDQTADTAWWNKENARLKAKINRLAQEIEKLRREILQALAEKAKYEKLRDQAAANLVQYKQQLADNIRTLDDNEKRRAEDAKDFLRSQSEHTDVTNAISAVLKELNKLIGSVSGKGIPQHVRVGDEEKRDLKNSFLQISQDEAEVQAFIELATSADQSAVKKLIGHLNKLYRSTKKSYNDDIAHEQRSIKAYRQLKGSLENDNHTLRKMIVQETKNHAAYVKRVAELIIKIAQLRKLRNAKIAERNATIAERLAKKKAYLARKAQRDEERRVMKRIDNIIKTRLANMSKYLNNSI
jgi:Txe/YoeB family toxin of Txe-Axe toxin-antitoxin module